MDLIIKYEVGGGKSYYDRFLKAPVVPPAFSGLTWGIGYDGGYNTAERIRLDWAALPSWQLDILVRAAGLKGDKARAFYRANREQIEKIQIPWEIALAVFEKNTIPRYYTMTQRTFPNFDALCGNSQGSLVSLVFNRGTSLIGPSRREMKNITQLTPSKNYSCIANEIRSMKRLWPGIKGLLLRRDEEARLQETCIR